MHYPSWNKIEPEKKAGVVGNLRAHFDLMPHMQSNLWLKISKGIEQHLAKMESSETREYSSMIQTYYDTHTVDGEEMLRLRDLGPNTPTGVPYTEDQIMAMNEVDSGSGSGGGEDDEPGEDEDAGEDEDDDGSSGS
nr:hypothetical protein [Tanacetum cinerariifolium]